MRALAKLVSVNNPDKVVFVGEALVGNEAVDQLSKFDRSLKDFSSAAGGAGNGRGIDGMLVTKWDTVDDGSGVATPLTSLSCIRPAVSIRTTSKSLSLPIERV